MPGIGTAPVWTTGTAYQLSNICLENNMVETNCGVEGCNNMVFGVGQACEDCVAKAQALTAPPMHPTAALLALQGYQLCKYVPKTKNEAGNAASSLNMYRIRRTLKGRDVQLVVQQDAGGNHLFTHWKVGKSGHANDYLPARWDELPPAAYDSLTRTPLEALALAEETRDDS